MDIDLRFYTISGKYFKGFKRFYPFLNLDPFPIIASVKDNVNTYNLNFLVTTLSQIRS